MSVVTTLTTSRMLLELLVFDFFSLSSLFCGKLLHIRISLIVLNTEYADVFLSIKFFIFGSIECTRKFAANPLCDLYE